MKMGSFHCYVLHWCTLNLKHCILSKMATVD